MGNLISNLRNKPENVRIKILWSSVVACMIVIVGIWFVDLKGNIQQGNTDSSLKEAVNNLVEEANISNAKSDIQVDFDSMIGKTSDESQVEANNEVKQQENPVEPSKAYQLPIE